MWLVALDVALLAAGASMLLTTYVSFFFHIIFVLLVIGAFFWRLKGFVIRSGIYVGTITAWVSLEVYANNDEVHELVEIFLFSLILLSVAAISTRRERMRLQLEKSQTNLSEAQRVAHLGSWEWDTRTGKLSWSDETFRIYGFEPGEVHPSFEKFIEIVHPDDRDRLMRILDGALHEHSPYDFEHRIVRPDGSVRVVHRQARIILDEDGEPLRMIGTVHDVTERKQAEERLRFQARLMENVRDAVIATDEGFFLTSWNSGAEEMYGWKAEEVLGRHLMEVIPTDLSEERSASAIEKLVEVGEVSMGLTMYRKDGTPLYVEGNTIALRDEEGLVSGYMSINRDITERRRTEEALRKSEARLQAIVDNSPAVVYVKDLEGRYTLVNRRFEELFKVGRAETLGKTDDRLFPEELAATYRMHDAEVLRSGRPVEVEEQTLQDDGAHTYISVKFLLHDGEGAPYAVCGISTDITESKRAEEALREAREMERRRIAHDLHDIVLSDLVYALQELQIRQLTSEDFANDVSIEGTAEALRRSVEGLRTAIFELQLRENLEHSLASALESLVGVHRRMARRRYEVKFVVHNELPALPERMGKQIVRIVQEALNNARRHASPEQVRVTVRLDDGCVVAEVTDDGKGFVPDAAGVESLGIASMHQRARALGGDLQVESSPSRGTIVRLSVPPPDKDEAEMGP